MYHIMQTTQDSYHLSDRLIRAVSHMGFDHRDEDITELIDAGADVNKLHGTLLPLHCACMVGDADIAEILLKKGAHVNDRDGYGRCALHYAAEKDTECVRMLLKYGADINQGDHNEDTALHWACYKTDPVIDCVRLLLESGAHINATDYNNDTPISWAARKGNIEVVEILLDYNADLDIRNNFGFSPLQRSASLQASGLNTDEDDETLELLIKASGQFNLLDESGEALRLGLVRTDSRLDDMLGEIICNVRPLMQLCLHRTRKSLGPCYLPKSVPHLPLPRKLQDFLLLKHDSHKYLEDNPNERNNTTSRNIL